MYTLLGADGRPYSSETRGTLGGNFKLRSVRRPEM